ncbi:pre-mRNA splicing factor RNA helicase, putative [Babesia bigemina]|uniref:RNA helicase n=1 Tax=Babesia bigemina TaxID=5866 RepID=A0A061DB05_BABBI|nr:pre-mRNA splicing factor RNA helicase, putative [Babesia bigemina]CDR97728.1 pre-mRNA splicing factor RNA helicase, putative [Babesia bigemina]|eukprot:XP_012769914.1 pre-mRNA splicing factor RNA helicase, putative [Babesia bigemina]
MVLFHVALVLTDATPRKAAERATENDDADPKINPFTKTPYSQRYYDILEKRRQLPAWGARKNFVKLLRRNQVLILAGDTGSGKTTQIAQFVVDANLNDGLQVAVTQPRRVAAMSVAARVANEMDVKLGETVGYCIRFEDRTSKNTVIKFMTDGMLLREAINDPMLSSYGVIILDEAHERTIATDVLFGLIKEVAASRENLKIVVMSATMDGDKFQAYFNGADMLTIPGRTFPVDIYYTAETQRDYLDAVYTAVITIHRDEPDGDILVFLTGEDEIRKLEDRFHPVTNMYKKKLCVVPLYGSMEPAEQAKVFEPVEGRKCVLATNIAETSLTIEGIVYVVDTGYAKQNVYNPRARVESLLVAPISQASATQRAGRAGRTRPGKCFRLYTEATYNELIPQTFPEILRSNIATVVLNLKKLGIDDLVHFDFMDPPAPETMMRALEELNYLGALDDDGELTPTGDLMGEFPLDPQMSKVIVSSPKFNCTRDVVAVCAMLSVPNLMTKRRDKYDRFNKYASSLVQRVTHDTSDHITFLRIFNTYQAMLHKAKEKLSEFFLLTRVNAKAMEAATRIFDQLMNLAHKRLKQPAATVSSQGNTEDDVLKCLCTGFFQQVAVNPVGELITMKDNQVVHLHPSSVVTHADWAIFHQVVHTSRTYIRTVSEVYPSWLFEASLEYFNPAEVPDRHVRERLKADLRFYKEELDNAKKNKRRR